MPHGSVVFVCVGDLGITAITKGEVVLNQQLHAFVCPEYIQNEYLAYWLDEQKPYMFRVASTTTIPYLNKTNCESIPLIYPPLPEQKAIAGVLSVWDRAIEKNECLIQAKEKRFKGLLQTLINPADKSGWKVVRLRDVATIKKGTQRNRDGLDDSGAYPAMNGGIGPSGYTDEWNTEENTITISEGGNSCGFVNYITQRFWCGGHCYALVRLSNQIENAYLFHFLKHHEPALMRLRVGSGLPNVQKRDIDAFSVQFPPICDQKRIAETLNLAQREIDLLKKLAEKQKLQKRGLTQKLLTGEWRVKLQTETGSREGGYS